MKMTGKASRANKFCPEGSLGRTAENQLNLRSRKSLEDAAARGVIIESNCIMCDCTTMQLSVDLPDGIRGIMPKNETCFIPNGTQDGTGIKDIAVITRVGKAIQFKIADIYENEHGEVYALLSRRAAQKECYEKYVSSLR